MKRNKSFVWMVVCLSILSVASHAWAGKLQPYDEKAFMQAQEAGKTIVVGFHADWCSTCVKQKPALEVLLKHKPYSNIVAFTADYDTSQDLQKKWKVTKQSMLIVFKGKKEVTRQMGLTSQKDIEELLKKGL